jgi:hypothetical protein
MSNKFLIMNIVSIVLAIIMIVVTCYTPPINRIISIVFVIIVFSLNLTNVILNAKELDYRVKRNRILSAPILGGTIISILLGLIGLLLCFLSLVGVLML